MESKQIIEKLSNKLVEDWRNQTELERKRVESQVQIGLLVVQKLKDHMINEIQTVFNEEPQLFDTQNTVTLENWNQ